MNNKRRSIKQKRRYQYAVWLAEFDWVCRVTRKQFYLVNEIRRNSAAQLADPEERQKSLDALEKELLEGPISAEECRVQQRRLYSVTGKSVIKIRERMLKRFLPVPTRRSEGETEMSSPSFEQLVKWS